MRKLIEVVPLSMLEFFKLIVLNCFSHLCLWYSCTYNLYAPLRCRHSILLVFLILLYHLFTTSFYSQCALVCLRLVVMQIEIQLLTTYLECLQTLFWQKSIKIAVFFYLCTSPFLFVALRASVWWLLKGVTSILKYLEENVLFHCHCIFF